MCFLQNYPRERLYFFKATQGEVIKASIPANLIAIARMTIGDLSLRHCFWFEQTRIFQQRNRMKNRLCMLLQERKDALKLS